MIRVNKPPAPRILSAPDSSGVRETRKLRDAHDAGERGFDFKSRIYAARSVKNALLRAQHGKCAFCEAKFAHTSYGDVEHYRPKGGWVQVEGDDLTVPGYYWLAYAWDNLYASCQLCNQRFKKNLFPLADPDARARSHGDDVDAEEAMLVDPGREDPAAVLGYRAEYAFAVDGDARGRATIDALGLNREGLAEVRRDRLHHFHLLRATLSLLAAREAAGSLDDGPERQHLEDLRAWWAGRRGDDIEYAAMIRAAAVAAE